ncbi:unnamed protein product [Urochloa decumbens]|uniref:DUF4220 domain-containing protein n=1 Tax=Urochloa decumbens TaxID=240449 RepID=A0ABC9CZJ8_9POAL
MVDVWDIVRWWDDWQLRILVLCSLGLQWFLLLAAPMRKYTIPRVLRTCIWLAYISSDALAIYALATLFNRHARTRPAIACDGGTRSKHYSSSILEVLWAPILLIHLGGQEELTAYEIEDNELWTRHTVTLVSQVAVALYAFYKSWPSSSDWKVLATAVLLFVVGVLSFSEKPWALNRAKINRLAAVSGIVQGTRKRSKWMDHVNQFFLFEEYNCFTGDHRHWSPSGREEGRGQQPAPAAMPDGDKVLMVLSDMSLSAAAHDLVARRRANRVADVLPPLRPDAEKGLRRWLRSAFAYIYTRASVVFTLPYLLYHLLAVPTVHIAALTLFATSDKRPYKSVDVKITYILLCLTAALDVFAVFIRQLLYQLMTMTKVPALCETVPGYNLIDVARREGNRATGWIYRCARHMDCKDEYFSCKRNLGKLYEKVAGTVLVDLVQAQDRDLSSYRTFTELPGGSEIAITRAAGGSGSSIAMDDEEAAAGDPHKSSVSSNWVLNKKLQRHCGIEVRASLRASFDRSVLLWHIATDLCFRCTSISDAEQGGGPTLGSAGSSSSADTGSTPSSWRPIGISGPSVSSAAQKDTVLEDDLAVIRGRECTQAISNYMAHLLNFNPDMLLTGSRKHLISDAMVELKDLLRRDDRQLSRDNLRKFINETAQGGSSTHDQTKVFHVPEACKLAEELLGMNYAVRWVVMYQVWLGMLCYSASMCRGYLHAKSLGEGGEFLSFVWLVLSLKGAKTLADKLQMPAEALDAKGPEPNVKQDQDKKKIGLKKKTGP